MSKFKYYIVDTLDNTVTGTNNDEDAISYSEIEENYVINVAQDLLLQANGDEDPINPAVGNPSS